MKLPLSGGVATEQSAGRMKRCFEQRQDSPGNLGFAASRKAIACCCGRKTPAGGWLHFSDACCPARCASQWILGPIKVSRSVSPASQQYELLSSERALHCPAARHGFC